MSVIGLYPQLGISIQSNPVNTNNNSAYCLICSSLCSFLRSQHISISNVHNMSSLKFSKNACASFFQVFINDFDTFEQITVFFEFTLTSRHSSGFKL